MLPKAICKELVVRGYDVAVFYAATVHPYETRSYYLERSVDAGVKLFGVYNRSTLFLDYDNPMREICDDASVKLFKQVLDEFCPDIVNFHNFLGLSFEIASVTKKLGIVSTFTPHNYHLIDPKLYIYDNNIVP